MAKINDQIKQKLLSSPAARAKFLSDVLTLLRNQGVDVDDPAVQKELNLHYDLNDAENFVKTLGAASSVIVTVVN